MTDPVHEAARTLIKAWESGSGLRMVAAVDDLRAVLARAARSDAAALAAPAEGKYRTGQPETAQKAATAVRLRTGTQRHRVLAALHTAGGYGMTDYELSQRLGLIRHVAGTRRGELQRAGLVAPTGSTRPTDTGHDAEVYVPTQRGLAALRQLEQQP